MSSRQLAPNMASLVVTYALNTTIKIVVHIRFMILKTFKQATNWRLASFLKPNIEIIHPQQLITNNQPTINS
jgi:hypothetical protein